MAFVTQIKAQTTKALLDYKADHERREVVDPYEQGVACGVQKAMEILEEHGYQFEAVRSDNKKLECGCLYALSKLSQRYELWKPAACKLRHPRHVESETK